VYQGYTVSPHYDSMIGKLITHAPTREQAIARMLGALDETIVRGIRTNIPLHRWILQQDEVVQGGYDTHFLAQNLDVDAVQALAEEEH
jgi:acetyl-CoA carboxylase biotin carboxylase subunit